MNKDEELEYLMNPHLFERYQQLSSVEHDITFMENKRFYRKRVLQMAKDCNKYKIVKDIIEPPKSLVVAFDNFTAQCIQYFKTLDENECYQTEYNELITDNDKDKDNQIKTSEEQMTDIDQLDTELLTKYHTQPKIITMDDFVEKKHSNPVKPLILPKHKTVDIKAEKYRVKGVKSNKI
jgi:hypothetical protein